MKTCDNFETNLENLKNLILSCKNDSLILAPELALVGFAYDKLEEASIFSIKAIDEIKELSENKIIANQGGTIAGNTRKEIEEKTGKKVVSESSARKLMERKKKELE